jgi:hypothetical protein
VTPAQAIAQAQIISRGIVIGRYQDLYVCVRELCEIIIAIGAGSGAGGVTDVTASLPLSSSGGSTPNLTLATPLSVANGGTGTSSPGLVQGTNVTITGTWPNQTISASGGGGGIVPGGTGTITSVGASVTSVTLKAANANRIGIIITNDSTANLYVAFAASATTSAYTVKLGPGGTATDVFYTGIVTGIWDSATGNARVTEVTA